MAFNPLRGAAQGIAGRALKKVAGNIRGGLLGVAGKGSNLSDIAGLSQSKYSTKNYSFPLDVEGPPGTGNQGHYIIFYVNQQTNAKLTFGDSQEAAGKKNIDKAMKELGHRIPDAIKDINGKVLEDPTGGLGGGSAAKKAEDNAIAKKTKKSVSTVAVSRPATVRMDTAITLYMPPSVAVQYGANYTDTEIGDLTAAAASVFQDYVNDKSLTESFNKNIKSLGDDIGEGMIGKALGAISMVPGIEGARETLEMQRGFIKAPRMELAFKGIPKRTFQYSFRMIPKSAAETEEIQKIIRGFKLNMLPEMVDGKISRLTIPNTFDIQYMYAGKDNQYLHKISTCVLETMAVTYGGDRYKTFEATGNGAPPVEVSMTLNFKEMDLITREKANEGF